MSVCFIYLTHRDDLTGHGHSCRQTSNIKALKGNTCAEIKLFQWYMSVTLFVVYSVHINAKTCNLCNACMYTVSQLKCGKNSNPFTCYKTQQKHTLPKLRKLQQNIQPIVFEMRNLEKVELQTPTG